MVIDPSPPGDGASSRLTPGYAARSRVRAAPLSRPNTRDFPPLFSLSDGRADGATRHAWATPLAREPRWVVPRGHPSGVGHGLAARSSRRRLRRRASSATHPHPPPPGAPAPDSNFDSDGVAAGADGPSIEKSTNSVSLRRLLEIALDRVIPPKSGDFIGAIRFAIDGRCYREGPRPP
jgi:hypothetical protein